MESEKVIKQKSALVEDTLIQLVKDTILSSRDLGAKPNCCFIGADVPYYANNYSRIAYRLILSGTIQVGMLKWSRKYGPNTLFNKDIKTSAPQVFVDERYEGEWLDRAKLYYLFQRTTFGKELDSVSQLYSGFMSDQSLVDRALETDENQILGDEPEPQDAIKFLAKTVEANFTNPVVGMEFLHWLGSSIPIIITVDHNSAQYIFRDDKQFLSPEEINLISQFGELCDASIQANPSLPSFSGISIPLLDRDELSIIREHKPALLELATLKEGDEDQIRAAVRLDIEESELMDLSEFTKKVVENELVYYTLASQEESKEKPDQTNLRKWARYLNYHTESRVEGNSSFFIFIFDKEDVHKSVTRKEISEIISCDRPREKFREALIFKHFGAISNKMFRKEKIVLRLEHGIQSIVPVSSGLTSTQLIKSIEKTIKEEVFRAKVEANKETDLMVDISLSVFKKQRREMLSNMEGIKIPSDEELLEFSQVAGHSFPKHILNTFVVPFLGDPDWNKILPQGIVLTGPPGTGKSFIAYALALYAIREGWEFVEWDPNALKRGIVGESDKLIRDTFDFFASNDKLLLWVDEGDVAFGSGRGPGGDGGVSKAIFSATLKFFGSAQRIGRTILLTATNRIEDMDPALRSRLAMILYMPKLDEGGIKQIVDLRLQHALDNIDPNIKFEGGKKGIASAIYKANQNLVGRQLLFAINTLLALAKLEAGEDGEVKVKKKHVDLLIESMNTRMSDDENSEDMDRESKRNATWKRDFRETKTKSKSKAKSKAKAKTEPEPSDDVIEL